MALPDHQRPPEAPERQRQAGDRRADGAGEAPQQRGDAGGDVRSAAPCQHRARSSTMTGAWGRPINRESWEVMMRVVDGIASPFPDWECGRDLSAVPSR